MAVYRCKMCGGDLSVGEGESACVCEFCGTQQTIPTVMDEKLQVLFNRANVLRMKSEFDKAEEIYEKILQSSESEAEAYWGLILCKYGIEYVEDPKTFKRVPTCHRTSYDAITADEDYKAAIQYADSVQKKLYEEEAKTIDEIQRDILAISQKEDAYDVFICYKETDENGKRTIDSTIANDVYYQLTQEGFKVFFAAITLEDKLGKEYEPYIFSALNTAKVMLVIGTKLEYFNAVWVKNEWSRYLKLMKKERSKILIPCYRDMDAYELPEEFAHLQAQDMSKIGFINDVVRGIKKIINTDTEVNAVREVVATQTVTGSNIEALLQRGNMALEDEEWKAADEFFEDVLNQNAQCAEAYIGKFLVKHKQSSLEAWVNDCKNNMGTPQKEILKACKPNEEHVEKMVEKYAGHNILSFRLTEDEIRKMYDFNLEYESFTAGFHKLKDEMSEKIKQDKVLTRALQYAQGNFVAILQNALGEIYDLFDNRISKASEVDKTSVERIKKEYEAHLYVTDKKVQEIYNEALENVEKMYQTYVKRKEEAKTIGEFTSLVAAFESLNGYGNSERLEIECVTEIDKIKENQRIEREKIQKEIAKKEEEKSIRRSKVIALGAIMFLILLLFLSRISKEFHYRKAVAYLNENNIEKAEEELKKSGYEEDSETEEFNNALLERIAEEVMDGNIEEAEELSENCSEKHKKNQSKKMLEAFLCDYKKAGYKLDYSFPIEDYLEEADYKVMQKELYLIGQEKLEYQGRNWEAELAFKLIGEDYEKTKQYLELIKYINYGEKIVKKKGYDKEIRKLDIPEAKEYLKKIYKK